jgi:parallel beta-helix repeat protein
MKPSLTLLALALFALPAEGWAKTLSVSTGPDAQERLQTALIEAQPGDVVAIGAGRFDLTEGLSLDVNGVTVRGEGTEATILSFKDQRTAGEGLLVTADDVVLTGFAVEDSKGDGIKSKGADRIVYYNLRVEWTGGPKTTNGSYGVYPVASSDVLIDHVTVRGASDAGIYVGQSRNIIVRNSVAMYNVAGIEIENCYHADVYQNLAMHNTGGILVFDLPNLPQMGGHDIRIFANRSSKNDTPNFAPKGNIVASVPVGTGVLVMANRAVVIFQNILEENQTANVMLIAYPNHFNDPRYNPLPRAVTVRDNIYGRAGWAPALVDDVATQSALGAGALPVLWDGASDPSAPIRVTDGGVLSLGLTSAAEGVAAAKPALADLSKGKAMAEPRRVVLPQSMEALVR